ncbi:MAG TPA: DUF3301 domain-containing protein [Rhodanobacteraceae bacterium]|nr:DUF3301 domain-containing protein [Rhodanobacteraceae bacterium]
MLEVWLPLLACVAIGLAWQHVMRLRERAVARVHELCARNDLQLLDDSVALHRLHVTWRRGTLRILREYRFDTSLNGRDRVGARMTLHGDRIVTAVLPSREPPAPDAPAPIDVSASVVPLSRVRRTLH